MKPLEELFRAEVFKLLKKEGKITNELINKLSAWRHSGFSVDNGVRIKKDDQEGREAIVQYMMRNVFSTENIRYVEKTGKVIYRTGRMQGKQKHDNNRKSFSVYDAEEFIAAVTQHAFSAIALAKAGFPRNRSRRSATMVPTKRNYAVDFEKPISYHLINTLPHS